MGVGGAGEPDRVGRFAVTLAWPKSLAGGGQAEWFEQLWLHGLHVKISFLMINKNNGKACWMAYGMDRHLKKQGVKCSLSNLGDEHVGSPVRAFQPSSSSLFDIPLSYRGARPI